MEKWFTNSYRIIQLKKIDKKKKRGAFFISFLLATGIYFYMYNVVYWLLIGTGDNSYLLVNFHNPIIIIFGGLFLVLLFGIIPGFIWLTKENVDYNPNIKLETDASKLYKIYEEQDISCISNIDKENMKYNCFADKMSVVGVIMLNIITLGGFSILYYGSKHNNLPKIQLDDFSALQAFGCLFIPIYGLYWIFILWLRLIDRINFQYEIRNTKKVISRGLAIVMLIMYFIPGINILSIIILESILVGQIQYAINGLVDENLNGIVCEKNTSKTPINIDNNFYEDDL